MLSVTPTYSISSYSRGPMFQPEGNIQHVVIPPSGSRVNTPQVPLEGITPFSSITNTTYHYLHLSTYTKNQVGYFQNIVPPPSLYFTNKDQVPVL